VYAAAAAATAAAAAAPTDFQIELANSQKLMSLLHPNGASVSKLASDASSNTISSRGGKRGADCVTVPKAHVALCTSKILTMEWIDGLKVCLGDAQGGAGGGAVLRGSTLSATGSYGCRVQHGHFGV
jgi:hypothetical protein